MRDEFDEMNDEELEDFDEQDDAPKNYNYLYDENDYLYDDDGDEESYEY
ncbi:hypothetical protein [Campylobacter hyointestinalis]|nr:hypothetical protein [Campylobacter hyointestinalis]QKF68655.1 hypothetical protein CHLWT_0037 [Campylobacter hyointestinalis subsp. lawsonii]